jgi:hypothetical protein
MRDNITPSYICPLCTYPAEGKTCPRCGASVDFSNTRDEGRLKSEMDVSYNDLLTALLGRTWFGLLYVVGCVTSILLLKSWINGLTLFVAIELPTLMMTTAVLYRNAHLRARVPFLWVTTGALAWAYSVSKPPYSASTAAEVVALAATTLIAYTFFRGVSGSIKEVGLEKRDRTAIGTLVAEMVTAWGATLQISFIGLLLLKPLLSPMLSVTSVGTPLLAFLSVLRATSPISWAPLGVLLFGLALFAAIRFEDDPYVPRSYSDVLPLKLPPVLNELWATLRVPTWIAAIIFGFVMHFVKQLWLSFRKFLIYWIGRLALILLALIVPCILMIAAHSLVIMSGRFLIGYVSEGASVSPGSTHGAIEILTSIPGQLTTFVAVNFSLIISLCVYIASVVPLGLEVFPIPFSRVPLAVQRYERLHGFPAANAIGRSYSLYGIIILAIPIATCLPGGGSFGVFSVSYIVLIGAAFIYYLIALNAGKVPSAQEATDSK